MGEALPQGGTQLFLMTRVDVGEQQGDGDSLDGKVCQDSTEALDLRGQEWAVDGSVGGDTLVDTEAVPARTDERLRLLPLEVVERGAVDPLDIEGVLEAGRCD